MRLDKQKYRRRNNKGTRRRSSGIGEKKTMKERKEVKKPREKLFLSYISAHRINKIYCRKYSQTYCTVRGVSI